MLYLLSQKLFSVVLILSKPNVAVSIRIESDIFFDSERDLEGIWVSMYLLILEYTKCSRYFEALNTGYVYAELTFIVYSDCSGNFPLVDL